MENENLENETPKNDGEEQPQEVPVENAEETPKNDSVSADELAELKKKAELAENYKVRAEKAESKLKAVPKEKKGEELLNVEKLPLKDIRALNDVHDDQIEWLINYAKFNKLSILDAKKRKDVKVYLETMAEERRTAEATNTKTNTRGWNKTTGEILLASAMNNNEVPEEEADIDKLTSARWEAKIKK